MPDEPRLLDFHRTANVNRTKDKVAARQKPIDLIKTYQLDISFLRILNGPIASEKTACKRPL